MDKHADDVPGSWFVVYEGQVPDAFLPVVRSNLLTLVISISAFVYPARARVAVLVHAGGSVLSDGVHRARFADTIARFRSVAGSQRGAADRSRGVLHVVSSQHPSVAEHAAFVSS